MENKYNRTRWACYTANICMSAVIIMPPLLFSTFRELYNISYSLLGTLVLVNFLTQLAVDLIFTFFSHKFNIKKTVKSIPIISIVGFFIYIAFPLILPEYAYLGLVIGTMIFSASSGFAEVLVSPLIAAIPSENPEKEMSKLHAMYAWGVVGVTIVGTLIMSILPSESWYVLVITMMIIPIVCMILFLGAKIPDVTVEKAGSNVLQLFKNKYMIFCFLLIFVGGASENVISQWSSNYIEQTLNMPKVVGDIVGVALFAVMLGVGRTLYANKGGEIRRTMLIGSIGAVLCYLVLIFIDIPIIAMLACALSGYCVAMLWPGSLILVQDKIPSGGVAMFALMAAGGDLGSALAPQLLGYITDVAVVSGTTSVIGLKLGMLISIIFPLISIILLSTSKK